MAQCEMLTGFNHDEKVRRKDDWNDTLVVKELFNPMHIFPMEFCVQHPPAVFIKCRNNEWGDLSSECQSSLVFYFKTTDENSQISHEKPSRILTTGF